jgi:hypothetical protein
MAEQMTMFSWPRGSIAALAAVIPGALLCWQGNVAVGLPIAVTLGALFFAIGGLSDRWSSFGAWWLTLLSAILLVTLGKVIGQGTVERLFGLPQDETGDSRKEGLAERAQMAAGAAEKLLVQMKATSEISSEQEGVLHAIRSEYLLIRLEEIEIRRYRLKKLSASVLGLVVAALGCGLLYWDQLRVKGGAKAVILPDAWQAAELVHLLSFGFLSIFVWSAAVVLLIIAKRYWTIFAITIAAVIVVVLPVGWSLHSSKPEIDLAAIWIVGSAIVVGAGLLFEPARSREIDHVESLLNEVAATDLEHASQRIVRD